MLEPEISLWIAISCIRQGRADTDVTVSVDGAHIRTGKKLHFDIAAFLREQGFEKTEGEPGRWQGTYRSARYGPGIRISSQPGIGDVRVALRDGRTLYVESKKIRGGNSGEYPAMREAVGQLMTGCPEEPGTVPAVAVPLTAKSRELAQRWSAQPRLRREGICFLLVDTQGGLTLYPEEAWEAP